MRFANLSVATATLITGAFLVAPGTASAADVDRYVPQRHAAPQQQHFRPQQNYRPQQYVVPQQQFRPPQHYVSPRPHIYYAQPYVRPGYPYIVGGAGVVGGYYYGNSPTYYGNEPYVPAQPGYDDDAVSYCIQTYGDAFDVNTMTYLANDGRRYPCP